MVGPAIDRHQAGTVDIPRQDHRFPGNRQAILLFRADRDIEETLTQRFSYVLIQGMPPIITDFVPQKAAADPDLDFFHRIIIEVYFFVYSIFKLFWLDIKLLFYILWIKLEK